LLHIQGMARAALRIEVRKKDQKELKKLLSGSVQQVRVVLRAMALLQMAKGASAPRNAGVVPLTPQAIRRVSHRSEQEGLERALYEKERPGAVTFLDDSQKQRLSPWSAAARRRVAPAGRCGWWPRKP
jgi:putative transposase